MKRAGEELNTKAVESVPLAIQGRKEGREAAEEGRQSQLLCLKGSCRARLGSLTSSTPSGFPRRLARLPLPGGDARQLSGPLETLGPLWGPRSVKAMPRGLCQVGL